MENFYLTCFLIGFLWSLLSLLAGSLHLHLPAKWGLGFHHAGAGHVHGGHGGGRGAELSPVNLGTLAAFLAWFGGTGYLLARYSNVWALLGLGVAFMSGLGGAAVIFWFVAKVLMSYEENLDPADYDMIGVLARVSSTIRAGGTGELIYSRAGTRRVAAGRSEDGAPIAKGAEVVVTRYDKGIAYVRRWDEMNEKV